MAYDANRELNDFHSTCVFVPADSLKQYESRRSANRDRLVYGLAEADEPTPMEFVPQGSYAMSTMIQSDIEHSDIDDGVVFDKDALKGSRGGDRLAADARWMVRDAVSRAQVFNDEPEVRSNCVRVFYADGFHVDLPVYREYEEDGRMKKELASGANWVASNPEDITSWFNQQVTEKSPDTANGRQLRRIVRLLKAWAKSRATWNMPSGFIVSVLIDEQYPSKPAHWLNRDDLALLQVMRSIRNRLLFQCHVYRPVDPRDEITNDRTIVRVQLMRDELEWAINSLSVIEQADCTELKALKGLRSLFNTEHFDARIAEIEDGDGDGGGGGGLKAAASISTPTAPAIKKGGTGQYG